MPIEIASRRLVISDHAIDRYRERWMATTATAAEASAELTRLVELAAPLCARTLKKGSELWQLGEVRAVVRRDQKLRMTAIVTILPREATREQEPPISDAELEDLAASTRPVLVDPPAPPPRAVLPAPSQDEVKAVETELQAALRDQADAGALVKEAKLWELETNRRVHAARERQRWLKTRTAQARSS